MTEEQFEAVCQKVEVTDCGVLRICKELGVPIRSFYDGLERNAEWAQRYARAKDYQADRMAEAIVEIADASGFDAKVVDGAVVVDGEAVQRARLRIDARKWVAAKLLPKKYGDRSTLALEGVSTEKLIDVLAQTEEK